MRIRLFNKKDMEEVVKLIVSVYGRESKDKKWNKEMTENNTSNTNICSTNKPNWY